ncbi:MAG: transglycosylase SLT domain-containing protein [Myxococcota bacterium]
MFKAAWLVAPLLISSACATRPPSAADDLCEIFDERRDWHRAARRSRERWGVPEAVQLAIIHQESGFRADARPRRRRLLWVLPGPRPSSAYGYGQVIDPTWDLYRRATGRRGADRDDFGDVTDFIGWYAGQIRDRTGVAPGNAYSLYLAYHEGPLGFARQTHSKKPWLLRAARRVAGRASRYARQYAACRDRLERGRWWWPF